MTHNNDQPSPSTRNGTPQQAHYDVLNADASMALSLVADQCLLVCFNICLGLSGYYVCSFRKRATWHVQPDMGRIGRTK